MRFALFCCFYAGLIFISCKSRTNKPNVSHIDISLTTQRFENDLFNMDTLHIFNGIDALNEKYPDFAHLYFSTILGADSRWSEDTTRSYIGNFLTYIKPVYDDAKKLYPNFQKETEEIKQAFRYLKYYFPKYPLPDKIITYVGPLDGYGDILIPNAVAVGLHLHLGKDYPLYQSPIVVETYPPYISRRFAPNTITVNCMSNIVNDMYPENYEDKSLIIQMVEKGKRLYVLQSLLPDVPEYLLLGYTKEQLEECYQYEKNIWNLFTQNNYLQSTDMNIVRTYIGESPRTIELGENAPGNIGSFAGWQIVKKFMNKRTEITPEALMRTPAEEVYGVSKYKP